MLLALFMSMISAGAKVASFYLLMGVLRPMFERGQGIPVRQAAAFFLNRIASLMSESVGAFTTLTTSVGATLDLWWSSVTPLSQLRTAATLLVCLVIFEQANKYAQKLLMRAVALDVVRAVRIALYEKIMTLSMRFFHANHSGRLLSRITNDLGKMGNLLVDVMVHWFSDVFTVVGGLWFVWAEGGSAVILGLVIAAVSFVPVQQLGRRIRSREQKNHRKMSEVFHSLSESLGAQKIVKAFGSQDYERLRFKGLNDKFTEGRMRSAELSARTEPMVEILGAVGVAIFLFLGGRSVLEGNWDGPAFFAVVMALFHSTASLRRLGDTSTKLQGGLSCADRVATLLFSSPEIVDGPDAHDLERFERCVSFEGVEYAHEQDQPVLQDVDFVLNKGQTLALVGHTGSGKSTISDLVMRFYDVDRGAVRVDGYDVRELSVHSLRSHMAVVTQETVLFEGTIASNIAYAMPDVSHEDIVRVAKAAHAHEFILRQPDGYETRVGERGATLSGGERQRIAIARALLRDKPILILDEATSALDTKSEKIVQDAIELLKKGRTTIVIAHRLSTIRDADLILVLDQGRIAERGHHQELMDMDGIYAHMVRIQSTESRRPAAGAETGLGAEADSEAGD